MVKIMNNIKKRLLTSRIESLEYKIEYIELYIPIYKEKLNNKLKTRMNRLIRYHKKMLLPLELDTLNDHDYVDVMTSGPYQKLENKYKLKKLVETQKLKRAINKDQTIKEELELAYQKKLNELDQMMILKKQALSKTYERHITEAELLHNRKVYDATKNDFLEKQTQLRNQIEAIHLEKFQKFQMKKQKELDKLKPKLKTARSHLIELLKHDQSSEHLLDQIDDDHILKVENLTMMFGGLKAVDDLSFKVKQNEIFGLIGPNGAGKTTVFNCITQFYKPNDGKLYYKNRNKEVVSLTNYKVHDVIKQGIVRTFQNVELILELSVLDNMLVGAHSMYKSKFFTQLFHLPRLLREEAIMKTKAINILKDLGLYVYKDFYPFGLPYGILKKIELARTLMTNPNLIILDEPAAGLNDMETKDLAQTIRKIQKTYNCTIFLVEHDMQLVMDICDTICAISFGKKLAIGSPSEIKNNKVVQEAYLGGD
jgi:branched-chain amino acid transport system ATP-binding protein